MGPLQVWGTCAVNDHQRPGAFVREVLLFDRVVVPYPDSDEERVRWRDPNPADPLETWDPERLDELLAVLGTQKQPGHKDARRAWTAPWSQARWEAEKTRREFAEIVTADAFEVTRRILAMGEDLPSRIEAVASYQSQKAWWQEAQPAPNPPGDPTAATALVLLARPLLLPRLDAQDDDILREAVELSCDDGFAKARTAYHDFVRDFVGPLQRPDAEIDVARIREADMTFAEEQLAAQKAALGRRRTRDVWNRTEWATMIVGTSAQVGLAAMAAFPVVGVVGAVASFVGYVAGKLVVTPEPRPLNGASMFVATDRGLPK